MRWGGCSHAKDEVTPCLLAFASGILLLALCLCYNLQVLGANTREVKNFPSSYICIFCIDAGLRYFAKRNETKWYFAKWYFVKRYFAKWYFAKRYFAKWYFAKWYFAKWYFAKRYFAKWYFAK